MTEPLDTAVADPFAPDERAPYGYMTDPATGERRPRIKAGRPAGSKNIKPLEVTPGASPTLDALKAAARVGDDKTEDRAPGNTSTKSRRRGKKVREPVPPFRAGPIATGMNKLYMKAGKLVRAWDHDIGQAIIDSTRKESAEDVTVGEAWEELAKTNPRIRAVLLKMVKGGAYGQLFMAHTPIFLAILMKDSIRKRIPMAKLFEAFMEDDAETGEQSMGQQATGLTQQDMQQAMAFAAAQMERMGMQVPGSEQLNGDAERQPPVPRREG